MAGKDSFLFKTPVTMFEEMSSHEPMSSHMGMPIKAKIKMDDDQERITVPNETGQRISVLSYHETVRVFEVDNIP